MCFEGGVAVALETLHLLNGRDGQESDREARYA